MTEQEYLGNEKPLDGNKIPTLKHKTGTPTQVRHPWKAVLRTFVAAGVGVGLAWLARVIGIDLAGLEGAIIDSLTAAAWAVGTGFVQWLLTRPGLQGFWGAFGLDTGVESEKRLKPQGYEQGL